MPTLETPVTTRDILYAVQRYGDAEKLYALDPKSWVDGEFPPSVRLREVLELVNKMFINQFNCGIAHGMLVSVITQESDDCTCTVPIWWQNEDAYGRPVQECEICGKGQSDADLAREHENAQADQADMAWKL
jgi:hypothetical protein